MPIILISMLLIIYLVALLKSSPDEKKDSANNSSPPSGYALVTSFSTFMRVFTHIFLTLIISSFILNKNLILARI
jgi:hypothetical protein